MEKTIFNNSTSEVSSIHDLATNIFYTSNWLLDNYKTILDTYNLKYNQYFVIKTLKKSYPNSTPMYAIHYSIIDKNINLSRLIDKLFNLGIVDRYHSINDRRVVEVTLTNKGVGLLEEIEDRVKKFENSLNEKDFEKEMTLNHLLNSFRESKKSAF